MTDRATPDSQQGTYVASKADDEASLWLARIARGLRPEEGAGLREWLKNPANRQAIHEMATLWHGRDVVAVLSELFPTNPALLKPKRSSLAFLPRALIAGTAAAIVVFGAVGLSGRTLQTFFVDASAPRQEGSSALYTTAVGESRQVRLADNSSITLNTATRMTVVYSQHSRDVNLMFGEASFDVAHDPKRPFNVRAGQRAFQVAGTRFNVRVLTPDDVELTVTEGNVKVLYAPPRWPETPAQRRENLSYGETTVFALEAAHVDPGFQSVRKLEASEVESRLAWHRGIIMFDGQALEDVLAEVDRYTTAKFVLADEKLRNVRIGGNFRTGDVNGLLRTLRENFLIDSKRDAQGRIVLTALNTP